MKQLFCVAALLWFFSGIGVYVNAQPSVSASEAEKLAELPLKCIVQKYPYKPGLVYNSDGDVKPPYVHHPSFYGCFDWHSAVHGHWSLVRFLEMQPGIPQKSLIVELLEQNLSKENIEAECEFFNLPNNGIFERPYGWAWMLILQEVLDNAADSRIRALADNTRPLTVLIGEKMLGFMQKLNYPIRSGEHSNTAFAMSLAYDYAVATGKDDLRDAIAKKALKLYGADCDYPIHMEPGGFDFLSPALTEAALMGRVMDGDTFNKWFKAFVPAFYKHKFVMKPAEITDRNDPKMVHLDGLNFSRAWCLKHIGSKLKKNQEYYNELASMHLEASLPYLTSGGYGGEHWLVTFAILALE